jgi:DICT domain-containing protein
MTSLTSSVLSPSGTASLPSAYDRVAATTTTALTSKRELLALSRALEGRAVSGGATTVLVTFQDRRHVTAATRASYARLTRSGTRVSIFARGLVSDYAADSDGLLHVALRAEDPLVLEWDIVVLGPQPFALVAKDQDPGTAVVGADLARPFRWARTTDPVLVEQAAAALLARVPEA